MNQTRKFIDAIGGQTAVARECGGLSRGAVWQWVRNDAIPLGHRNYLRAKYPREYYSLYDPVSGSAEAAS